MTPQYVKIATAICALAAGAGLAHAQDDGAVFRSDARLVVLHATVVDRVGNLMTDLQRNAFHIFENGVPQEIKIFRREDVPVSMGLVIDDSASMQPKRERVKAASLALVKASNPDDEVFIVNFNDRPYLDADFTSDTGTLAQALDHIDARGVTAMRDAVRLSIAHLDRKAREDKKALLVVTDGEDNASSMPLDQLVRMAQQSGVIVYAVGFLSDNPTDEARRARRDLDTLTKATGGQAYYLNNVSEIGRAARDIAHDIRNQYTIAYTPTKEELDGTYREIHVILEDARPLTVRTRSGYWAVPERPRGGRRAGTGE